MAMGRFILFNHLPLKDLRSSKKDLKGKNLLTTTMHQVFASINEWLVLCLIHVFLVFSFLWFGLI